MFGCDDAALAAAERMGKRASEFQSAIREQIQSASGAARKPEAARKLAVDVHDTVALRAKLESLRAELSRSENRPMRSDLIAICKSEPPATPELTSQTSSNDTMRRTHPIHVPKSVAPTHTVPAAPVSPNGPLVELPAWRHRMHDRANRLAGSRD
jgi:hypothetical protein